MKVTININGVDVEIQLTPEQEALAVKQAKPKFWYIWHSGNTWRYDFTCGFFPERVYMTELCAIEICRMLNAGEFSLDNEL